MNNKRKRRERYIAVLLAAFMLLSLFPLTVSAAKEQDKAQISLAVSNSSPASGEIVTVTVSIDNYVTMTPRIAAMSISLSFDSAYVEYVSESAESLLDINKGDITSVNQYSADTVNFAYAYANTKKATLPTSAVEIFSFKLKVKSGLENENDVAFTFNDLTLYNGKDPSKYTLIECKEPIVAKLTAWPTRPPIMLNGSAASQGTYAENVEILFDTATASLIYEGRDAAAITSPYICNRNGDYTVKVKNNGTDYSLSFTINKELQLISVKPGTLAATVLMGMQPDYSSGRLTVTYTAGDTVDIPMNDPDVVITGFDPAVAGDQRLLITYKGKTTSYNLAVIEKSVITVTLSAVISKTEYLLGDDIDVTGGKIYVVYDDFTNEYLDITPAMLSGYDKTFIGQQIITVTYGTAPGVTFTINVISKAAVDDLVARIEALDLTAIKINDKENIEILAGKYNALSAIERSAVINASKLQNAIDIINSLINVEITTGLPSTIDTDVKTAAQTTEGKTDNTDNLKTVWIIVAVIVGVSVVAGVIYFIVVFIKKKRELDDDEYYDEDLDDEDGDDTLSYDEDLFRADDDKEEGEDDDDED